MNSNEKISFSIENALEADIESIAEINFNCWKYNFIDIFEDRYLKEININLFKDRWHNSYSQNQFKNTFVACSDDGNALGFITVGKARNSEFVDFGEVYAIYVDPKYQFKGIGKSLWSSGIDRLKELDFKVFYVWILSEYFPGMRFINSYKGTYYKKRYIKIASNNYVEFAYKFNI